MRAFVAFTGFSGKVVQISLSDLRPGCTEDNNEIRRQKGQGQ